MATGKDTKIIIGVIIMAIVVLAAYRYLSYKKTQTYHANDLDFKKPGEGMPGQNYNVPLQDDRKPGDERHVLEEKIAQLDAKLLAAEKTIDKLSNDVLVLGQDNLKLKEESFNLKAQAQQLLQEKEKLEARLSSLKELKIAIREVKVKIHRENVEKLKARIKRLKELDEQKLAEGNQGFIIKEGKTLFKTSLNIEITPAP